MKKHWVLVGILAGSLCASDALAQHQAPNQQPNTAAAPTAPTGDLALGTRPLAKGGDGGRQAAPGRHLRRQADGAGSGAEGGRHDARLSSAGSSSCRAERVKGREVVSIVPQAEIKMVVKDAPPAAGASKVQVLRGNEYVRVWINKGGNHYLIHLPAQRRDAWSDQGRA